MIGRHSGIIASDVHLFTWVERHERQLAEALAERAELRVKIARLRRELRAFRRRAEKCQ